MARVPGPPNRRPDLIVDGARWWSRLLWAVALTFIALCALIWSGAATDSLWPDLLPAAVGFASLLRAHEELHALGHQLFGGLRRDEIHVGWVKTHGKHAETARAFRALVALPAPVLAVVTFVAATAWPATWLTLIAMPQLAAGVGDFGLLWRLRGVPGSAVVLDRADGKVGCEVWLPARQDRGPDGQHAHDRGAGKQ